MTERRWVIWRCDACRVPVTRGLIYLLTERTWHVRHPVMCHPKDHEKRTVASIPVRQIQWTDQFSWWLTLIEASGAIDMFATNWVAFLDGYVSVPTWWRPERVDLSRPGPAGVVVPV